MVTPKEVKCESCGTTDKSRFTKGQLARKKRYLCGKCQRAKSFKQHNSVRGFLQNRKNAINPSRGYAVEIDIDDLLGLWKAQNGLCAVTGLPMTWGYGVDVDNPTERYYHSNASIDRINGDGGYTKQNIRLVCNRVNLIRNVLSDAELYFWCRAIADGLLKNGEK